MKTVVSQSSSLIEEAKFGIVKNLYNRIVNNPNNQDDLQGRLHSRGEYEYQVEYLQQKFDRKFFIQADKYYFHFQDPEVEKVCEQKFSSDGYGCTLTDIQNVICNRHNDPGSVFKNNTKIEHFDELNSFTNVTCLPSECFRECTSLKTINLENIEYFHVTGGMQDSYIFYNCSSLEKIYAPNLTYTGVMCFANCTSLKYIVLPIHGNIARDDGRWIQNCNNLEYVMLGKLQNCIDGGLWSSGMFCANKKLKVTDLGDNLLKIADLPWQDCSSMQAIIIRNTETIPTVTSYENNQYNFARRFGNNNVKFFVSDNLLNDYKNSSDWNEMVDKLYPLSEFKLSDYIDFEIPEVAEYYSQDEG